jgi:hypothetical protein
MVPVTGRCATESARRGAGAAAAGAVSPDRDSGFRVTELHVRVFTAPGSGLSLTQTIHASTTYMRGA